MPRTALWPPPLTPQLNVDVVHVWSLQAKKDKAAHNGSAQDRQPTAGAAHNLNDNYAAISHHTSRYRMGWEGMGHLTGGSGNGQRRDRHAIWWLSSKRSGLQLLSGHRGCPCLSPPTPLEGAAHEPCLRPSNGGQKRPGRIVIGHNFRVPAPAIGQKMVVVQDRVQAHGRPACIPLVEPVA